MENIVHSFKPRNKTEKLIWGMLTTGAEVAVAKAAAHSQRQRNAVQRIQDAGVKLMRLDSGFSKCRNYILPDLTRIDCVTNRIIETATA